MMYGFQCFKVVPRLSISNFNYHLTLHTQKQFTQCAKWALPCSYFSFYSKRKCVWICTVFLKVSVISYALLSAINSANRFPKIISNRKLPRHKSWFQISINKAQNVLKPYKKFFKSINYKNSGFSSRNYIQGIHKRMVRFQK